MKFAKWCSENWITALILCVCVVYLVNVGIGMSKQLGQLRAAERRVALEGQGQ